MEDIIEEVLLRFPVKFLVRCKSLSKKWQNIISHSSSFRQRYTSRIQEQGASTTFLLGFFYSKSYVFPDVKDHVRFLPTPTLPLPLPLPVPDETLSFTGRESLHIVGSSNGFLLSSVEQLYPMNYLICNPINKQWHPLPTPNTASKYVSHGFICHTSTPCLDRVNRYTIVRGIWHRPRVFGTDLTIEIFSSDSPSRTWKLFSFTLPFSFYLDTRISKAIIDKHGVIYLRAVVRKETVIASGLIIFDQTKDEQVRWQQLMEFPTPEKRDYTPFNFGQSNGLLLYVQHERHISQLQIWKLTQHEDGRGTRRVWVLIHKVGLEITMDSFPQFVQHSFHALAFEIRAFHPTNPQLLFFSIGGKIVMCDASNSTLELVCDFAHDRRLYTYFFFPYTYGLIGPHLFVEP